MDVSVVGASGDCGREIVSQLLDFRVLAPTERLQLVGRAQGKSARSLYGLRSDLEDAYAEVAPHFDVALHPEEVVGDIVVFCAGATLSADGKATSRDELVASNLPLFHRYAAAIAHYGHGQEIILIVTNPVELAVDVFSRYLGRQRVIGIGAYSDSLRFRREIARDLGVRRQLVQGFVVGEHGEGMVPLWSSVRIYGFDSEELTRTIEQVRRRSIDQFPEEIRQVKQTVFDYLKAENIQEAYRYVDSLPPDLRVVLKPFVTQMSGAKTISATANVTVNLVRHLMEGQEIVVSGQVKLDGEFYDLREPFGVPIVVTPFGWTQVVPLELWEDEVRLLKRQSDRLKLKLQQWTER
ncbi:MAG: malate dehydrogenase [Cyanophyceae cyanobacterium]